MDTELRGFLHAEPGARLRKMHMAHTDTDESRRSHIEGLLSYFDYFDLEN